VTRQFSLTKLCRCAREHESLPRLGRLQRARCTHDVSLPARLFSKRARGFEATDLSAKATAEIPATTTMVRTRTLICSLV